MILELDYLGLDVPVRVVLIGVSNSNHCLLSPTGSDNDFFQLLCLKTVFRKQSKQPSLDAEKSCIHADLSSSLNNQVTSGRRECSLKPKLALKDKFSSRLSEFKTYLLFLSTLYHEDL